MSTAAACCSSSSSNCTVQLFVRAISGFSLVLHANPNDTIRSIHDKIRSATGIPVYKQPLIYDGKQLLQLDHTLFHYNITNNSTLYVVARIKRTQYFHPQARELVDGLRFGIKQPIPKGHKWISVSPLLTAFLNMIQEDDHRNASSCLNVFASLGAPEALVKLYVSPRDGQKKSARHSIQYFLASSKVVLQKHVYHQLFAPIVLQFCKVLRKAVTHDDPLYIFCRNSLGSILDDTSLIAVQDIWPFVDELATKLSQGLVSSMEESVGPSSTDARDLNNFLRFMMNAIIDPMLFDTLIPVHYNDNHPWYDQQVGYLYSLYLHIFPKLKVCLTKLEDDIKVITIVKRVDGRDQYLSILKLLHYISQLYEGAEETFWTNLWPHKVAFNYLIVRFSKRADEDYKWILDRKDYLTVESRRHLVVMLLPEVTKDYENEHTMLISRSNLQDESFESITQANKASLRGPIFIQFTNEEANGPGVLREWFMLVCQAIFNPQNALFLTCPTDRRRFFPNPASKVNPLHLEYYRFSGRVIALALMHNMQVGIVFGRAFFLQLAGSNVSLEDIKDADPYLYRSCKQILEMDPCVVDQDVLGLTFTWEVDELGVKKVVELCPDGEQISVNSINRNKYIDLIIEHLFVTSISEQLSKFSQGFVEIFENEENVKLFFKSLELEELDGMLYGSESEISVDDWKAHTEYKGYKETDCEVHWFWKIVEEMSMEQRKVLLFFWTSVKHPPVEGFRGLASRLSIIKSNETCDRLPSSHTCFYEICVPAYPSRTVMQQRLNIITQEHIGCTFGNS